MKLKKLKKSYSRRPAVVDAQRSSFQMSSFNFVEYGFNNIQISIFFVSPKTTQRQMNKFLLQRNTYSCMSDLDLDELM